MVLDLIRFGNRIKILLELFYLCQRGIINSFSGSLFTRMPFKLSVAVFAPSVSRPGKMTLKATSNRQLPAPNWNHARFVVLVQWNPPFPKAGQQFMNELISKSLCAIEDNWEFHPPKYCFNQRWPTNGLQAGCGLQNSSIQAPSDLI